MISAKSKHRRPSLTAKIIIGALLGAALGYAAGTQVMVLGQLGKIFIQLIKAIALPLVFFAIVEALISTKIPGSKALRLTAIVLINAALAVTIGLGLSNYFNVGSGLELGELKQKLGAAGSFGSAKPLDPLSVLSGFVPQNLLEPFVSGNMFSVVLIAILIGLAVRAITSGGDAEMVRRAQVFHDFILFMFKVMERLLLWLIELVPLAVFGVVAATVGEHGFSPFRALAAYVLVVMLGLSLQILLVYSSWVKFFAGRSLKEFWREARGPAVYAFGVNSSLATLPLTLHALDNLRVSKASSRLGACVGTNFNNDGILLYEAMAVLFVAQALGFDLSLSQQIGMSLICAVTAMGVAGVPEAGVVALSLVLSTLGIPLDVLPLLLTVDWLIARARSVTNVLSDLAVSIVLDNREIRA